ncbi:hypothetical protein GCM10010504_71450 [Streptomyces griseus]|nr:hypothetical protein GCM10010504_71450 [Streptomyces griseus]
MAAASVAGTKEIGEQHLIESGLVVLDITVDDDETVHRGSSSRSGQHGGNLVPRQALFALF